MKAAVFEEPGKPLAIRNIADPQPEDGEVVVKVRACGICGTDLHYTGDHGASVPPGTVLGHEFSGEVVAIGLGVPQGWKIGDRLCTLPYIGCGSCLNCLQGAPWQCPSKRIIGFEIPGGYAEFTRVHVNEAVKLPPTVSWHEGALVEPLAVGLHGVRLARSIACRNVLVVGAGPIGLSVALWCRFFGARNVIVSDLRLGRRELALQVGATGFVDAAGDVNAQFREHAGGEPEVVFECVGVPGIIARCIDLAAYGSEMVVVGFCTQPDTFVPAQAMVKEIGMKFSIGNDKSDFQFIVEMLAARRIDVKPMITGVVGFDHFPERFEGLRKGGDHCKLLLEP